MKKIWTSDIFATHLCVIFVIISFLYIRIVDSTWWYLSLASSGVSYQNSLLGAKEHYRNKCLGLDPESPQYLQDCQRSRDILDVVKAGAAMGLDECQYQFRDRRWNCTTFNDSLQFGRVLETNSREKAYLYSISSAGVMHAITKACSKGELSMCSCDQRMSKRGTASGGDFMWGGCSDDVNFGYKYTKSVVDINENTKEAPGLMNLWNNNAGRFTVKKNLRRVCKCHGVSASCEMKICWRAMPSFNEVGENLKQKFDGASRVKLASRRLKLRPAIRDMKRPTHQDLVYLELSPDYCNYDPENGILGTSGRRCNATSNEPDSCSIMCCGRGYYTLRKKIQEDCNCQFFWCCEVKCEQCKREVLDTFCN